MSILENQQDINQRLVDVQSKMETNLTVKGVTDVSGLPLTRLADKLLDIPSGAGGDMLVSTYDPQERKTDIFKTIDDAIVGHTHKLDTLTGILDISRGGLGVDTFQDAAQMMGIAYGLCETPANTVVKAVSLTTSYYSYNRIIGSIVCVNFVYANTATGSLRLNFGGTGVAYIYHPVTLSSIKGTDIGVGIHYFMFNGTQWVLLNPVMSSGGGSGDMLSSMYDPQGKKKDIFKAIEDMELIPGPQGEKGDTGDAGKSAFDSAVQGGYTGNESRFYIDLAALDGLASAMAAF